MQNNLKYALIILIFLYSSCSSLPARKEIPIYDAKETSLAQDDLEKITAHVIRILNAKQLIDPTDILLLGPHTNNTSEHLPIPKLQTLLTEQIQISFPQTKLEIWENVLGQNPELRLEPQISDTMIQTLLPWVTRKLTLAFSSQIRTEWTEKTKTTTIIYFVHMELTIPYALMRKTMAVETWSFGKRVTIPRIRP